MSAGKILVAQHEGTYILKFVGEIRLTLCSTLDQFVEDMFSDVNFNSVVVDLTETTYVDSTSLGLLAKISIHAKQEFNLVTTIISTNDDITRLLLSMGFDQIFAVVSEPLHGVKELNELPLLEASEEEAKIKVLEAHKTLMEMNETNRTAFKDLVDTLEQDQAPQSVPKKNPY